MNKYVLFIQGGGAGGYEVDKALAASLQTALGKGYDIVYPEIQSDESAPDFGWTRQIGKKISAANDDMILAGHSFGASMILKYLSENSVNKKIDGIFLNATPFWIGNEEWQKGLTLRENFAEIYPGKSQFSSTIAGTMTRHPFLTWTILNKDYPGQLFERLKVADINSITI